MDTKLVKFISIPETFNATSFVIGIDQHSLGESLQFHGGVCNAGLQGLDRIFSSIHITLASRNWVDQNPVDQGSLNYQF